MKKDQEERKQREIQAMIDEVRSRVKGIRNQQAQISIKKAEAAIEYAVSLGTALENAQHC